MRQTSQIKQMISCINLQLINLQLTRRCHVSSKTEKNMNNMFPVVNHNKFNEILYDFKH